MKARVCLTVIPGIVVAAHAALTADADGIFYRLWYYVPAAVAAGSLAADRMKSPPAGLCPWAMDGVMAILGAARPLFGWPPVSGHAAFFVHALLTGSSRPTLVLAVILGLLTLYAKIILWHWDATLWPGLACGVATGLIFRRSGCGTRAGCSAHDLTEGRSGLGKG